MAYYLPPSSGDMDETAEVAVHEPTPDGAMADIKVFWGPDICRLEYLVHLLDTGRIVDECPPEQPVTTPS